jgi:hypothetical protein
MTYCSLRAITPLFRRDDEAALASKFPTWRLLRTRYARPNFGNRPYGAIILARYRPAAPSRPRRANQIGGRIDVVERDLVSEEPNEGQAAELIEPDQPRKVDVHSRVPRHACRSAPC